MDTVKELLNGKVMPALGLGTWHSPRLETEYAVKAAIDAGFRHIDCAHSFKNEVEVGRAIAAKIKEGVVTREELFITSKLWNTFHDPEHVVPACISSLNNLCLDYLDLYLMQWPMGYKYDQRLYPIDSEGKVIYSSVDYVLTWKSMESLVKCGFVRSIGLSNFNQCQMERVLCVAGIKPVVLQIECHPYLNQFSLMDFCKKENIVVSAYSPLGAQHTSYEKPGAFPLLCNPLIMALAKKHKRSTAQILLRFQLQRGNAVVTRSIDPDHMMDDLKVFEFKLGVLDMHMLCALNMNGRIMAMESAINHQFYPFYSSPTSK